MRKVSIYLSAYGGQTVNLEVEDNTTDDEIKELAYQEASLSDCECYDWDNSVELEITEED